MIKRYPFLPENRFWFFLIIAFKIYSLNVQAQNGPAIQWDKTFGGNGIEDFRALQQTSDGGYILAGFSNSGMNGNKSQLSKGLNDFWILKLDINGNKLWDKSYGGNLLDQLCSMQQTADGGYILGGESNSDLNGDKSQNSYAGSKDYWIVKLDSNGNKIWDKTYGGNDYDVLITVQQTSDGGYILGGRSLSGISGDKTQASKGGMDYWIIKLDPNGNKVWDKTYGGLITDLFNCLRQTSDGGYILGGASASPISGDKSQANYGYNDYWVIRIDQVGNKLWDKTFGGSNVDGFSCLQQTFDGGFILGGNSNSGINGDKSQASKGDHDYWIIKIDSSGNKIWDKTYGGNSYDQLNALIQVSDGSYLLGGGSSSSISGDKTQNSFSGNWDYWIVKISPNGTKVWDKTVGGFDMESLDCMKQTSDGGFLLGGVSDSGISGNKTQPCWGNWDYWIIKLAPEVLGIKESEASFNLTISPNPNQGKFNLLLSNLTAPKAEVTVSDLLGRVVLQKQIQATNNQLSEEFSLPNAKGIYLLQLKAGEQIISRKIVVE